MTIVNLVRNERPLMFFSFVALVFVSVAVALGLPVLFEYFDTGLVRRFPTAILCSALGIVAVMCIATGLVLDLVAHVRREAKLLEYLRYPSPRQRDGRSA
jgi:hypothetical protein